MNESIPVCSVKDDRTQFIGASDAAAVVGLSRWRTPLEVWAEKTGAVESEDISGRLPVKLGNLLEPVVAQFFTEHTGKKVHRAASRRQFHPQYPFLSCETDFELDDEDAVLQCKAISGWKKKEWEGDEIPMDYILQEFHEMACVPRFKRAYIAVLIGNEEFVWKVLERSEHEKAIADLVRREVEFWTRFVVPKVMPAAQVTGRDGEVLFKLFKNPAPQTVVQLPSEAEATIDFIESLERDKDTLESQIEKEKNALRLLIGEAEAGETATRMVTWKKQITKRVDSKRLQSDRPEIYNQFLKASESRVLRFTKKKEA